MPVPDPAQQLGFCAVRLIIGEFGLVRGAPPGSAATTDRNKTDADTQAKRLSQQFGGGKVTNAPPTLIAAINGFSVTDQLRADSGTQSISSD